MSDVLDPKEHLPQCYKDIREIDIISAAAVHILSSINEELQNVLANNFAQTANEKGIEKFEKMLGIAIDRTLDLETRRQRVLSKMSVSTIFTLRALKANLSEICDGGEFTLEMDNETFFMRLNVRVGKKGMLEVLYDLLYMMLPAHVGFYIDNKLPVKGPSILHPGLATSIKHTYMVTNISDQ